MGLSITPSIRLQGVITSQGRTTPSTKTPLTLLITSFVVDCVFLRVLAKKAVGSRNYAIDVVGYSDDKILNVTRKIGGFLQNVSGDGSIPVTSGFNSVDDLGISSETLSDADQYYKASGTKQCGWRSLSTISRGCNNNRV